MNISKTEISSNTLIDNLFVNFPLWFPICYVFLTINFPVLNKYLFIGVIFLFAETHFASTWLFFFDRENWDWMKKNSFEIVILPLYIISLLIITWFVSPNFIILIHYLASGWHVTKQSVGLVKIYSLKKIYQFLVYFISFSCLIIGIQKPGILSDFFSISQINLCLLGSLLIYVFLIKLNTLDLIPIRIFNYFPFVTGILIYLPILFFKNITIATAVGVGMHWCQYIAIVWSTYLRKTNKKNIDNLLFKQNPTTFRILFVFIYSIIMTLFAYLGMPKVFSTNQGYSYPFLIPVIFQIYHFYIDGFIWKFSDPQIKKSVLKYLFKS